MEPLPEPPLSVSSHTISVNGTSLDGPLRDRGRICVGRGGVGAALVGAGRVCVCAVKPAQVFSRMRPTVRNKEVQTEPEGDQSRMKGSVCASCW